MSPRHRGAPRTGRAARRSQRGDGDRDHAPVRRGTAAVDAARVPLTVNGGELAAIHGPSRPASPPRRTSRPGWTGPPPVRAPSAGAHWPAARRQPGRAPSSGATPQPHRAPRRTCRWTSTPRSRSRADRRPVPVFRIIAAATGGDRGWLRNASENADAWRPRAAEGLPVTACPGTAWHYLVADAAMGSTFSTMTLVNRSRSSAWGRCAD